MTIRFVTLVAFAGCAHGLLGPIVVRRVPALQSRGLGDALCGCVEHRCTWFVQ